MRLTVSEKVHIPLFVAFESNDDTSNYVSGYSEKRHKKEMNCNTVQYLSVFVGDVLCGFIILAYESDTLSVEFRRIVISSKGKGFGQRAIYLMEDFCKSHYDMKRIWLDVYEDNLRAQHVYIKCGYLQFGVEEYKGRKLLLFEKWL